MGNERADEAAKNALEEDINNRELYPPQDQINWMKKTEAKNRQERWALGENTYEIQKGNYRVEGLLNQQKQKGARLRTGTHEQQIDTT
jgi:hypothetical protein